MSKLKLEHGVSRIRRAKLQSSIDQTVADDIEMLAQWSNNETNYIVNELLRFALTQDEDFQKYKTSSAANTVRPADTPAKPSAIDAHQACLRTCCETDREPYRRTSGSRIGGGIDDIGLQGFPHLSEHHPPAGRAPPRYSRLGFSAACGIVLNSMFPINTANPLLRLIALERPAVFHTVVWSYGLFLYSTPFLAWSMIFSLLYRPSI